MPRRPRPVRRRPRADPRAGRHPVGVAATRRRSPTPSRRPCARCRTSRSSRDGDAVARPHEPGRPSAGRARRAPRHRADRRQRARAGVDGDSGSTAAAPVDMKAGVAVQLRARRRQRRASPTRDLTFVFYDNEEVEAELNGLGRVAREHPDWLDGDFASSWSPPTARSRAAARARCGSTSRPRAGGRTRARSWLGVNAIHGAGRVLDRARRLRGRATVEIDGWTTARGSTRSASSGGVAGNVIPDECVVTVNYRFAPDRDEDAGRRRTSARSSPASTSASLDVTPPAGAARPRRAGGRRRSSPRSARPARAKLRLDRRRPLRRPRHPRGQLRPGRPEPRPHPRRARAVGRSPSCSAARLGRRCVAYLTG